MKTFSSAYYISKKQSIAEKETLIEQEHNKIIAAMKKEFGINSFSTLNESEKKSYRSMLKEMWNREKGLTVCLTTDTHKKGEFQKVIKSEGNMTNWEQ